jgi:hypothetical protein
MHDRLCTSYDQLWTGYDRFLVILLQKNIVVIYVITIANADHQSIFFLL